MKLDKKDFRILFELELNCRQSITQIAKKTMLSRDVVRYRILQLEKKGIITQYFTLLDFSKLGFQIIRLYLKLQKTTQAQEQAILAAFKQEKNLLTVYRIDGKYDIASGFLVANPNDFYESYERLLKKFKPHIENVHISILLDLQRYPRNYLVDKQFNQDIIYSTRGFTSVSVDSKDLELLNKLSINARASLVELAKALQMSVPAIKYKLRQLEKKGIIIGYKAEIDFRKIGYSFFKVDLVLEDYTIVPSLAEFLRAHPNVIFRDITIGGTDFEFDCELPSTKELYELIELVKQQFPGKIREHFYYEAIGDYKYNYFPNSILERFKG